MSKPVALLLDMDGVMAEVSRSYRGAIIETCKHFLDSSVVTNEIVSAKKAAGGCNNDWVLSRDLISEYLPEGSPVPSLDDVTERFELLYQGDGDIPGLHTLETLIPAKGLLVELRRRCPGKMAVVTGRPRSDCDKFLKLHGIDSLFDVCVCMEDGPAKPDKFPVEKACKELNVEPSLAVMVGDTPDDVRAGLAAGTRAIAVATPDDYAKAVLDKRAAGSGPLAKACLDCGAESVMVPGLAELLDVFEA
mmetsp:Transcript_4192/g.8446  ORF Transcript_4192/g.8446 Transcript_4192/m.8446 type:complete len:248 (-) Transcript_4192:20-763(-)